MSDGIPERIPPDVHRVPAITRRGWRGTYAIHGSEVPSNHVDGDGLRAVAARSAARQAEDAILVRYDDVRELVRATVFQATGDRDASAAAARRVTLELARQGRLR